MANSAQNIPLVGVSVIQSSTNELQREERRREQTRARLLAESRSSIQVFHDQGGMSSSAEAPSPHNRKAGKFDQLKEAFSHLEGLNKEAARELGVSQDPRHSHDAKGSSSSPSPSDDLSKKTAKLAAKLDEKIKEFQDKGREHMKPSQTLKMQGLMDLREKLGRGLEAYQTVLNDNLESAHDAGHQVARGPIVETESVTEKANWVHLEKLGLIKGQADKHVERVGEKIQTLRDHVSRLNETIKQKAEGLKKAQTLLAGAKTAEEEAKARQLVQNLMTELKALTDKKAVLQAAISQAETLSDQIVRHQTRRALGIEADIEPDIANGEKANGIETKTLQTESLSKEESQDASKAQDTSSTTRASGRSSLTLKTESLPSAYQGAVSNGGSGAPLLALNDFSGTLLAIQSVGNTLKADASKTDKLIRKLLQAAVSGNWEAIKSALIFLDKRAGQLVVGMGAQAVKAMQLYEQQLSQVSGSIGKLKGTEVDYQSRLAKLNTEMNQYSQNRSAISNFLRDTMSMREEIANETHSVLQKDSQIASSIAR